MIKVYGIKNCNTMKKTFDLLESEEIDYVFEDYKKTKPSEEFLNHVIEKIGLSSVVNKKGTTYRKLNEEDKLQLEEVNTAIPLLIQYSSMIKRPILKSAVGEFIVGYEEDQIRKLK
ncbi:arsenate reductase [Anditalea andensis]|uniref:Arsenate reductase n=2 Tax=Anditalea andensis TaxID=1048983 RepID=A0A074L2Y4_9BACT|nr:arsenate reductase [Anditalea andensis]